VFIWRAQATGESRFSWSAVGVIVKQFEQWKMGLSRGARGSIDAFIAAEATQGCNWNEPQIRRWLKLADDMNRSN
jgi:hypothetical protein